MSNVKLKQLAPGTMIYGKGRIPSVTFKVDVYYLSSNKMTKMCDRLTEMGFKDNPKREYVFAKKLSFGNIETYSTPEVQEKIKDMEYKLIEMGIEFVSPMLFRRLEISGT